MYCATTTSPIPHPSAGAFPIPELDDGPRRFVQFNQRMEETARLPLNETELEQLLAALPPLADDHPTLHWLTAARIMELALICAGDYADACEFEAAGDLLVNPRAIDIHLRGQWLPVRKARHARLSDQFAAQIGAADPVAWLARNTHPVIRQQPLIPALREWLASSGIFAPAYLRGIDAQMRRIADAIAFLSAWVGDDALSVIQQTRTPTPETRALLDTYLCRFDRAAFDALGDAVRWLSAGRPADFHPCVISILI